jgi:hypothetical protein
VFYLYWDFRVLNHCWAFQSHFDSQNFHLIIRLSWPLFDSRLYLDISRSFKWIESFIFRYFKVFQLSQLSICGLSDLLLLAVGLLVVFVLREYILKVHIHVSSEHKLCQTWNICLVKRIPLRVSLIIFKNQQLEYSPLLIYIKNVVNKVFIQENRDFVNRIYFSFNLAMGVCIFLKKH